MQTQNRLLLEEQCDQGLHCLPFHQHPLKSFPYGMSDFCLMIAKFSSVQIFKIFTIYVCSELPVEELGIGLIKTLTPD